MDFRLLLLRFRKLVLLPSYLPYDAALLNAGTFMSLWGKIAGRILSFVLMRGLLRSGRRLYLPVATFVSCLLRSGDIFFDVGAYDGLISFIASTVVSKKGQVHSFEPNSRPFMLMNKWIKAYGISWTISNNIAVSDKKETGILYVPRYQFEASLKNKFSGNQEEVVEVKCRIEKLDSYISEKDLTKAPVLIKIDVEGAELEVLRGASNLFSSSTRPMVLFEANLANARAYGITLEEVMQWLKNFGYIFYILCYPNLVRIEKVDDLHRIEKSVGYAWSDVLALAPDIEIHAKRLRDLSRRFKVRITTD